MNNQEQLQYFEQISLNMSQIQINTSLQKYLFILFQEAECRRKFSASEAQMAQSSLQVQFQAKMVSGSASSQINPRVIWTVDYTNNNCKFAYFTSNGEFLFECEPKYGTLVRPNQVKLIDDNPFPAAEGEQQEAPRPSAFGAKSSISSTTSSISSFMQNRIQNLQSEGSNPPAVESNEASKARSQNWKNKIEELRLKKQQEQQQQVATNVVIDPQLEEQKKDIGKIFAPAAGLNRANDGSIAVNQEQAQKPVNRFAARLAEKVQAAVVEEPQPVVEEIQAKEVPPVEVPKPVEVKPAATGKLGALTKLGQQNNAAATNAGASATKGVQPPTAPKAGGLYEQIISQYKILGLNSALQSKLKNDLEEKKDKISKMAQERQNRQANAAAPTTGASAVKTAPTKTSVVGQPAIQPKTVVAEQKAEAPGKALGTLQKKPVDAQAQGRKNDVGSLNYCSRENPVPIQLGAR